MKGVNREEVGRNCEQKEILISVDFRSEMVHNSPSGESEY